MGNCFLTVNGSKLTIESEIINVDVPHGFAFLGTNMTAIKNEDNCVDICEVVQ